MKTRKLEILGTCAGVMFFCPFCLANGDGCDLYGRSEQLAVPLYHSLYHPVLIVESVLAMNMSEVLSFKKLGTYHHSDSTQEQPKFKNSSLQRHTSQCIQLPSLRREVLEMIDKFMCLGTCRIRERLVSPRANEEIPQH